MLGSAAFTGLTFLFPGRAENPLGAFFIVMAVFFAVSLSGWLIAIPLVLVVNDRFRLAFDRIYLVIVQ